jgi:hypothetical protein
MARQARDETGAVDAGVSRLRDILVEEVSLVDRAANKRRFLIVKRKKKMASGADDEGETETSNGRPRKGRKAEGATTTEDAGKARRRREGDPDEEPEDTEKGRRPRRRNEEEGEETEDADKARARHEGNDEQEEGGRRAAKAEEEEGEAEEEEEEAEDEEEEEAEEEEEEAEAEKAAAAAKEEAAARKPRKAKKARRSRPPEDVQDEEQEEGDDAAKRKDRRESASEDPKKQKPWLKKHDRGDVLQTLTTSLDRLVKLATQVKDSSGSISDEVGREAAAIAEIIRTVGAAPASAGTVAKAGARMAKDRLERFNKAIELLSSILKELTETRQEPPAPTAGAAQAGVDKNAPQATGVAQMVASLGQLTEIVKRQGDELARLRQAPSASNALPVDGARRSQPEEVAWPMDMNRPIRRDQVNKELSFYDE